MFNRILLIFLFPVIFAAVSFPQSSGYTNQVARILSGMPGVCIPNPAGISDSVMVVSCIRIANEGSVNLRYHISDARIEDVGLAVFDSLFFQNDAAILYFIERTMLEISIINNPPLADKRLNELQTMVGVEPAIMLKEPRLDASTIYLFSKNIDGVTISRDSLNYNVNLKQKEAGKLSFHFPADIQLITGMDKVELDTKLEKQIKEFDAGCSTPPCGG